MAERYDPQRALTEDWQSLFTDNHTKRYILPCVEGDVEMTGAWMLLNIMITLPLIRRNVGISRDLHLQLDGIYNAETHAARLTEVSRTLEDLRFNRVELGPEMIESVNMAHNLCYTHLGDHIMTTDIFAIADTILQPEVADVVNIDYGDIKSTSIKKMEEIFKVGCENLKERFLTPGLPYNSFFGQLKCEAIKINQWCQFALSAGPKTDTDDHLFLSPVTGSFLSGMRNIRELAIESRSAAKAGYYNKTQMSHTQYQNRKLHIQASVDWHLYRDDCGALPLARYDVTKGNVKHFLGHFYLAPDGELREVTRDRYSDLVGKTVQMRATWACRWTDGYCRKCGGTITNSFSPNGNVGFLANVNTGADVAQQVLSTKHLTATDAVEYEVPEDLQDVFTAIYSDVFVRTGARKAMGTMALGFQPRDISKLNDLKHVITENDLHPAHFSEIKYLTMGKLEEDGSVSKMSSRVSMGGESKTYPHLSPEALAVIREYPDDIIYQDNIAWFVLRNMRVEDPIFQCTIVNNSVKRFVSKFSQLISRDVERYTSINEFMRDLCRVVWSRTKPNITHIETLARACLITSKIDYSIPVVEDPDKVKFSTLGRIIPMRGIGSLLAFQGWDKQTNLMHSYLIPKPHGIYDEYLGYRDLCERDDNWPIIIDSKAPERVMK